MQIPGGALELIPLIPVAAIVIWGAIWTIKGQIAQAVAERIRGSSGEVHEEVAQLRDEIAQLRAELELTHDRIDCAERVLTQGNTLEKHPTPV